MPQQMHQTLSPQYDDPEILLRVDSLTKQFSQVVANRAVSFEVRKGEIHCLLGENGAGKSTLAECLYGFYRPDAGQIFFKGRPVTIHSPAIAAQLRIGMVHQHFTLARPMTVLENVVVGVPGTPSLLDLARTERELAELCRTYGIELDLHARVQHLSVGEQQWLEILKALYSGLELLILDEPTAVLTPQETERLLVILNKMKMQGISIIFITHKLWEVMSVADRITVLRKGEKVATIDNRGITEQDLACMMVGREVVLCVPKDEVAPGPDLLSVQGLCGRSDRGQEALANINLTLKRSEILAIAGVTGNGQREFFETLIGVRKASAGRITFDGSDITGLPPDEIMRKGILHVPGDRINEGLLMDFSIKENLILGWQQSPRFRKGLFLDLKAVNDFALQCIRSFGVVTSSGSRAVRTLSGGNLQKVILAREFSQQPRCLVVSQPTRGLDIGAIEYVHCRLLDARRDGVGIILISEDLDEIFALADRIAVIFRGAIMGILDARKATREQVGLLMAGVRPEVQ